MWIVTLRSTMVTEARYYVGGLHEQSSRPAQPRRKRYQHVKPCMVVPSMVDLVHQRADLGQAQSPRQMGWYGVTASQSYSDVSLTTSGFAFGSCCLC